MRLFIVMMSILIAKYAGVPSPDGGLAVALVAGIFLAVAQDFKELAVKP